MEEIQNTEPAIQPTVQVPKKKTRYWLWFGLSFALIMWISFFGRQMSYSFQGSSAGLQIFYSVFSPISHILYISDWLQENWWMRFLGYFLALASEGVPFLFWFYPIILLWVYFIIGMLLGKIYGKAKSNPKAFAIFLLIVACFVTYRLYTYKQKYYPSQSRDCLIYSNEFEQWACISQLAREKKDISMCKNVPAGSYYVSDCYSMVAEEVREYGVCDKMPFWEEWRYPHKTACRDDVAFVRSECDKISTQERRDYCYQAMAGYIQQYAGLDKCNRFREILGWKPMIQLCDDFRLWKISMNTLCEKIVDEKMKNECISQKPIGRIEFGPEKPEPVEWLYGPGTPETEEEIRNRSLPVIEKNMEENSENMKDSWLDENVTLGDKTESPLHCNGVSNVWPMNEYGNEWDNKFSQKFPEFELIKAWAECPLSDGSKIISYNYWETEKTIWQVMIKYDENGNYIAHTEWLYCSSKKIRNYFRFQDEKEWIMNIFCRDSDDPEKQYETMWATYFTLDLKTMEVKFVKKIRGVIQ